MARASDFKFWEQRISIHRQISSDPNGDHIEFQFQKHHDQDQFNANSPPLWTKIPKTTLTHEEDKSPLLPHDHHYSSCLSPKSRSRAILDGKRELMDMIKDLPESSFDLSLKDIVEDHAEVKEMVEEKKAKHKMGTGLIPQNDNKNTSSKLCRSESMESGVFLLKMFLPPSLISSRKRSDSRKWPTICQRPAYEGSEKSRYSIKWWKAMYIFVRDYKNRGNGGRSKSEISSGKNSLVDGTRISCEWSLCINRKCKSRGQRGCLF